MLAGVLLSDNLCTCRRQPFVAVAMTELPVGVDEMRDGLGAEFRQRLGNLRPRHTDAGIDQHFAIAAGEDGDVSSRALKYADVVPQFMSDDGRCCGAVLD